MSSEADQRKAYVKEKQLHHLFELLASKTLAHRPENVYQYLRERLTEIEEGEKNAHKYDPSQVHFDGESKKPKEDGSEGSPVSPGSQLKVNLSIFGLNNAGKTALVSAMGGAVDKRTTPTVGFSPMHFETDDFLLCIFDLGGGQNFRGIWQHYYADCHGYIYVVDASDRERLQESIDAFADFTSHKYVQGKPVLIFANKKDVAGALTADELHAKLNLSTISGATKIIASCAVDESELSSVEDGVEWMMSHVKDHFPKLQKVIDSHAAEVKAEKEKAREEQRKRVEAARAEREAAAAAASQN